jgi:transcriptional regulator of acetoin/glycerol metabolism
MTQTERKVIRAKVGRPELAKQLGNVTQAWRVLGYSRDSFYRVTRRSGWEGASIRMTR